MMIQRVQLAFSIGYRLQSDGQSKVVNKDLENYLTCFIGDKPRDWASSIG